MWGMWMSNHWDATGEDRTDCGRHFDIEGKRAGVWLSWNYTLRWLLTPLVIRGRLHRLWPGSAFLFSPPPDEHDHAMTRRPRRFTLFNAHALEHEPCRDGVPPLALRCSCSCWRWPVLRWWRSRGRCDAQRGAGVASGGVDAARDADPTSAMVVAVVKEQRTTGVIRHSSCFMGCSCWKRGIASER